MSSIGRRISIENLNLPLGLGQAGTITTLEAPLATDEVSFAIPNGTKQYTVRSRESGFRLAFVEDETADNGAYISVARGSVYGSDRLDTIAMTLYLRATKDAQVFEITTWQ